MQPDTIFYPKYVLHNFDWQTRVAHRLSIDGEGSKIGKYKRLILSDYLGDCTFHKSVPSNYIEHQFIPFLFKRPVLDIGFDTACIFCMDTRTCRPILMPISELIRLKPNSKNVRKPDVSCRKKGWFYMPEKDYQIGDGLFDYIILSDGIQTKNIAISYTKKGDMCINLTSLLSDLSENSPSVRKVKLCVKRTKTKDIFYDGKGIFEWNLAQAQVKVSFYSTFIPFLWDFHKSYKILDAWELANEMIKLMTDKDTVDLWKKNIQKYLIPSLVTQAKIIRSDKIREALQRGVVVSTM